MLAASSSHIRLCNRIYSPLILSFLLSFISTHFSASGGQWQIQHCKICPFLDVLPHCSNSLPSKNSTPTTVAVFSFVAFRFYGFTYITGPSRNVPDRTRQRRAAAIWIYDNDDAALISLRFRNRQSRSATLKRRVHVPPNRTELLLPPAFREFLLHTHEGVKNRSRLN